MGSSEFQATGFLVKIAEVFLHCGISAHVLRSFGETVLGQVVLAQFEVGPTQRIEISAVRGIKVHCLLDHA